jgi:hypothetical protein
MIHGVRRFAWRGRHDVGVQVRRHGELRVPEDLHHHSRWHVLRKQQRGAGVPQVVEANAASPALVMSSSKERFRLRDSLAGAALLSARSETR